MVGPLARVRVGHAIVNSMLLGLPLVVVCLGARALKRARRRRRGLCVKCKYQVAGLATCPECGTAVRQSRSSERVLLLSA